MSTLLPIRDKRLPPIPSTASTYHHDPLLFIERQSKYIQRSLQTLIDAQSEGLLSGLGQASSDDASDRSNTPTSSQVNRPFSPTNSSSKPPSKKVGLRAAREGIFQSIYDLLKLREEEREILSSQSDQRDNALHEIEGFSSRRTSLEEAIAAIHNDRQTRRAKSLQEEARGLETDIHELETRLLEMKARHRHIVREMSNIENSVDAKLSSYNESLSLLQSDIQTYLKEPPVQPLSRKTSESGFHSLNPKRRTLETAQDHWKHEQEELHKRQRNVDAEIVALEEGGAVWRRAVADISGFEKKLKVSMRRFMQLDAQAADGAPIGNSKEEVAAGVSQELEQITQSLQSHLERAEEQDWKLLVCCISAELEALYEAKRLLLPAFGISLPEEPTAESSKQTLVRSSSQHLDETQHAPEALLESDHPDPPPDLLKDGVDHHEDSASRSEDDEPDPSWLLETEIA